MIPAVIEAVSKADVVVVGPGLGMTGAMPKFVKELIPKLKVPFLLDADALNALSGEATVLQGAAAPCILTPIRGDGAADEGKPSNRSRCRGSTPPGTWRKRNGSR